MRVIGYWKDARLVERFLWLPMRLGGTRKWLRRAGVYQKLGRRAQGATAKGGLVWHDVAFVEDIDSRDWLRSEGPVVSMFGLSYSAWLAMPRTLMMEMPLDWQFRMCMLIQEFNDTFDWLPQGCDPYVQFKGAHGAWAHMPPVLCNYRTPHLGEIDAMRRRGN